MHWITPSEKNGNNATFEKHLQNAADQFLANSSRKALRESAQARWQCQ